MKINPKEVMVNLPTILTFEDYHEIDSALDLFNNIMCKKIKAKELFSNNGYYYAIFYLKQDKEYRLMVKEHENSNRHLDDES